MSTQKLDDCGCLMYRLIFSEELIISQSYACKVCLPGDGVGAGLGW